MKKNFIYYLLIWLICLAAFNALAFAVPAMAGYPKFTATFWIGYSFATAAFLLQLAVTFVFGKSNSKQKRFLNIAAMYWGYIALITAFVVGGVCVAVSMIPTWIAAIVCSFTAAFYLIAILKAQIAVSEVERVDADVRQKTAFIRLITAEADALQSQAKTEEERAITKRVYEAFRYSDPMSCAALIEIEDGIKKGFARLSSLIGKGGSEASAAGEELLALIETRNKKCKALK